MDEDNLDIELTNEAPRDIQRVSKDTVNKILSAQVILNVGIAVKELIENSVDAGSTVIEIKIKEYGKEGFEVSDNGLGIEQCNFEGITAKHHTSKLKSFQDLESIHTFGFRGEALSSLCGLSDVVITTRHSSSEYGTKLIYNNDGQIIDRSIIARNIGTSVMVSDFFKTLPVRKAEFQKNYKKDFNKMIKLLEEYCLVLVGVKIIAVNILKNGSRQTILSTNGQSILDNIVSIFGAKQSQEVIKIKCPTNDGTEEGVYTQESLFDADLTEIKTNEIDNLNQKRFKIDGYISNIDHACGRTLKDRQYLYVNSRPCEMKAISKLVNEIYRKYNMKHFPFFFINLKVDQSNVDVNLSKDKRQIAICDDKVLLLVMKRSLSITFGDLPTKFKYASINSVVKDIDGSFNESDEENDDKIAVIQPSSNFGASLKQWKIDPSNPIPKPSLKRKLDASQAHKTPKIDSFMIKRPLEIESDEEVSQKSKKITLNEEGSKSSQSVDSEDEFPSPKVTSTQDFSRTISYRPSILENTLKFERKSPVMKEPIIIEDLQTDSSEILEELKKGDEIEEPLDFLELSFLKSQASNVSSEPDETIRNTSTCSTKIELDVSKSIRKFKKKISLSIDTVRNEALEEETANKSQKTVSRTKLLKFKERIDPSKNKKAETELETEIKKDMFKEMKVLGQFNLGFIIAQLERDLFIVDQHATDERYNFEQLEKNFKLETQHMVIPEKLELTAVQEDIIIDNLNIFEMNGFKFLINQDGQPTQRIQLISRPYSKNHEFGREDIEEMTHLLQDNSTNCVCRPSRIRAMLASRACRKSVMIGTALDRKSMMKLLIHMGEIDHPWNCPHGRPTIRFLQNLDFIASRAENNEKCND
ncbi:mismatch repair endonuclease PMS2 [Chironomus tepperi]|uniref:mismatch repair endonuclease PMS2 n=1 Tax=Chironomus tepperi TaxID=113505 RepID=UPI00391F0087